MPGSLGVTHFAKKGCPRESGSTLFLVEGVSQRLFDPPFSGKRGPWEFRSGRFREKRVSKRVLEWAFSGNEEPAGEREAGWSLERETRVQLHRSDLIGPPIDNISDELHCSV